MELETLFIAAIQSSFMLGLLHGINPCGHSWLVLAPFVSAEKKGSRVALLTSMFLGGTAIACVLLGASLGAISQIIPESLAGWVEIVTSVVLIVIGLLLLYNPHILHNHEHQHEYEHEYEHEHHHGHQHHKDTHEHQHQGVPHLHSCTCSHSHHTETGTIKGRIRQLMQNRKLLPTALFALGFFNMIIPCPTAAVMYTYALNAGSIWMATLVFGTYAISTAIAVGMGIYLIFRVTKLASSLQKEWIEPFIMRFAGIIIIVFSSYGIYHELHI